MAAIAGGSACERRRLPQSRLFEIEVAFDLEKRRGADSSFGSQREQLAPLDIDEAERLIGSIRRECLNHVIIFNEMIHSARVVRINGKHPAESVR